MIVVDVGCAPRTRDDGSVEESIGRLISRFRPSILYGFDPGATKARIVEDGCPVIVENTAAWTYDGFVGFAESGITSQTGEMMGPAAVPCFDLAKWLPSAAEKTSLVLKLDCEGAEYELLPHVHAAGADGLLDLLLVEWHGSPLSLPFRCPVEVWS